MVPLLHSKTLDGMITTKHLFFHFSKPCLTVTKVSSWTDLATKSNYKILASSTEANNELV